jgi:signal transduction histidine kinase/CheY-like chemotaxis protein/ABC-type amino acid transport substrate-binding protein
MKKLTWLNPSLISQIKNSCLLAFAAILLLVVFPSCGKSAGEQGKAAPVFSSYRDIPGVTEEEINAIEGLRGNSFIYGMTPSTEAFIREDNAIGGFSALFCQWLSELFGIPFEPIIYEWGDLLAGLDSGRVDFTGDMVATKERRKIYSMTDAIAIRSVKTLRMEGSRPVSELADLHPLRCCFLTGSITKEIIARYLPEGYEVIQRSDFDSVYLALKSGEADAFFVDHTAETAFDSYDDVIIEDFFPVIYGSVSLATKNPAFTPVISVVQKALENGSLGYLTYLYKLGENEYRRHKLFIRFTDEEKNYIQDNPVVPFAAEYDNYPLSFYNKHEKEWQGIAFDILGELKALTGLSVNIINNKKTDWPELLYLLESGKAYMISELLYAEEREGLYLWPQASIMTYHSALISKSDYPNVNINDILCIKVGLIEETAYASLFQSWFPDHKDVVTYKNTDAAFNALERGEIDMVMANVNQLIMITNYYERVGYKANIVFDNASESTFGFHKDEALLCSIVDKALRFIDTKGISGNWTRKTYDYSLKMARSRRPWIISAVLLSAVLALLFALFQKNRHAGMRLERLVQERTAELSETAATMQGAFTKLEALISNYKGLVWSINQDRVITTFNGQHLKKLGITSSLLEGKKLEKNQYLDIFQNVEKTFLEGPQDWISNSNNRVFHSNTTPMRDDQGNITGIVGSTDDITDLVGLERKLETALESAKAANHAKSEFLARMSHEIRTPMNAILGIAEMELEREDLLPDMREALSKVYNSGYLLLSIINDILDLSKIESGKLSLQPIRYDIPSLINDTVQLNVMRFESKPVDFKLQIDESVPASLFGDELRIKQILNNILSNAFKFTGMGEVSLLVAAESEEAGASAGRQITLVLSISDTGCGMTPAQVDKLFADYTHFSAEASRTTEGTGLGMGITKNLVDLMNGEITVKSEQGKGSVFTVRLPQGCVDTRVLGRDGAENLRRLHFDKLLQSKTPQIIREYMPYGKVLVVDDMEPNLYVAKGLLAPYGLSIETASSGFEAIDIIKNGAKYDIIFMDHFMPKMDGVETVKKIRDLGYTRPIVALTANVIDGQEEMFLANGFDAFISKPLDIRQLNAVLNQLVRDKYSDETIEAARQLKGDLEQDSPSRLELNNAKALVVDDFLPNLNAAAGMLRKYKMRVDCALNGQEAVDRIKSGEPEYNFIFMDHLMPEMDGIEATLQIRALGTAYAQKVPIIALTANEVDADERMFLDNGFQAVLFKPISMAKLDVFIKNLFVNKINQDIAPEEKEIKEINIDIPGINGKKITDIYDGDLEVFLPVLRSYVSAIPAALEKMRAVSEETLPEYMACVHGVKSTSESIGAEAVREMAAELESLAKADDLPGILAKNAVLLQYAEELLENIRQWLEKRE